MRDGRLGRFSGWHYGVLFAVFFLIGLFPRVSLATYDEQPPVSWDDHEGYCSGSATLGDAYSCSANHKPASYCSLPFPGWTGTDYYSKWQSCGGGRAFHAICPSGYTFDHDKGDICTTGEPPPLDCSASAGKVIQRWTEAGLGSEINVDGCGYQSSGVGLCVPHLEGFNCYSDYTGTGNLYSGSSGDPSVPDGSEPPCISGDSGNRVCGNPRKMNCGKFNGTSYCVSPNDVPGCKQSVGGLSVICAMESDGSAPPGAPTTDFGSPVGADQTWDHIDQGENLHHMGGWNESGSDGDGSGDGSGSGEPGTVGDGSSIDGDNNGDGECQSGEDCAGGGPELGEHPDIPTSDIESVDWVSGLPSSATCPAPETINIPFVSGASFQISYQPLCDFAVIINPLVLAAAYLSAAFILVGGLRK